MLPCRGLARTPASALRYSLVSRTKPTRTASTRQFSQAQSQSALLSRRAVSGVHLPQYGQRVSSLVGVGIAGSVFAQRSGASRNLSLWPFSSRSQNAQTPETPVASSAPQAVETETLSTPSDVATETAVPLPTPSTAANEVELTDLPDHLLRQLDSQSLLDIPERIGYLSELGLDFGIGPSSICMWMLEHIHVYSGMPWWGSLTALALLFRAIMFYPALTGASHMAKFQKVQATPAYLDAAARLKQSQVTKDQAAAMQAWNDMRRLRKQSGGSTWRSFVQLAMIPFSIGMFRVLRGMADIPVPGLENGGLAWFTDLTVRDPFFILPVLTTGLTYIIFKQMQRLASANPARNELQDKIMQLALTAMAPVMFLSTMWFPAGLQWLFFVSSLGALMQNQTLLIPGVRRWLKLPPIPINKNHVIPATAREVTYQSPRPTGFTDSVKSSMEAASEMWKNATGATPERAMHDRAKKYENRRAVEDKAGVDRRIEEIRRRRAERRS
ncbi:hypothetical protein GGS21DRAFT_125817 [Xylaria nigripes]|nr:hypothetical protein GGS21DRAFT_125817 [Xylaria nigripes]